MALRRRELARHVVAVARTEETLRTALERGVADSAARSLAEAANGADLVVLAAPVSLITQHLELIAETVSDSCLVTDVGSVKAGIVAAAEKVLRHPGQFVGGHPLAGSERRGIAAARSDLLDQATWVLTPTAVTDARVLKQTENLVVQLGARPLLLSPHEHDQLVARTSHLPHLVAAALVNLVAAQAKERPETLELMGQGFRDTTRIAAGDAALWADIALANADALLAALEDLHAGIGRFSAAIKARNRGELERLLADAQRVREEL
jgi:prephenate dehydrogenase